MDDGWSAFFIVIIIWAACAYMERKDRKEGRNRW